MIILPFSVRSRATTYDFVDRDILDSEDLKLRVNKMHADALAYTQRAALCGNRGLPDQGEIDNKVLAVFDAGDLIGIWMLGCITYVSGPWEDVRRWERTRPAAPIIIDAVPMSGILGMADDIEADFAAETAAKMVSAEAMLSGQGIPLSIQRLHYGIFEKHDDRISRRTQAHHRRVKEHAATDVTERPHPTIRGMTLVEVRARAATPRAPLAASAVGRR